METLTVKTTKTFDALINALEAGNLVDNNQVNYMMKILNGSDDGLKEVVKNYLNSSDFEGLKLSDEQNQKSFDWLMDQWQTPTGSERKNNPFGYREQDALENFSHIELSGYYDAGNRYVTFNVPIYDVYTKDGYGFNYYVSGGQINIIG